MSDEKLNGDLNDIPEQPSENLNIPDNFDLDINKSIPDNIELDIGGTKWDSNIEERSSLPDFEYDVDPPETDD